MVTPRGTYDEQAILPRAQRPARRTCSRLAGDQPPEMLLDEVLVLRRRPARSDVSDDAPLRQVGRQRPLHDLAIRDPQRAREAGQSLGECALRASAAHAVGPLRQSACPGPGRPGRSAASPRSSESGSGSACQRPGRQALLGEPLAARRARASVCSIDSAVDRLDAGRA